MQIPYTGSVYNFVKTMKLEMQWQRRKANPLMEKGDNPELESLKRQAESALKSNKIAAIDGKLKSGQQLSLEEMEYLRVNSPQLYEEVKEIQAEREQYRKELEKCKTKDDVSKLNARKLQEFANEATTISNNPNIPEGKKIECLEQIMRRVMGINSEHSAFVKSSQYAKLPTELENHKKEEKEKKERRISVEEIEILLQQKEHHFLSDKQSSLSSSKSPEEQDSASVSSDAKIESDIKADISTVEPPSPPDIAASTAKTTASDVQSIKQIYSAGTESKKARPKVSLKA